MFGLLGFLMLLSVDSLPDPNFAIKVNLADEFATEDQWVYLIQYDENEVFPLDSCFIRAGQKEFLLHGNVSKEDSGCRIVFTKNGPSQVILSLDPGDDFEVDIIHKGRWQPVRGSIPNEMSYAMVLEDTETRKKIDGVRKELETLGEDEDAQRKVLEEELEELDYHLNIGIDLEYVKKNRSARRYRSILDARLKDILPEDQFDELVQEMKRRFPDNERIQAYPESLPAPPPSERSRYWMDRLYFMQTQQSANSATVQAPPVSEFSGTHLEEITLPDREGNEISLSDITTPYIFVDFWAAWCAPCRREIPHIKTALEKYGDKFTVYAISIDNKLEEWLKAIEKDGSGDFTHVFVGNFNEQSQALLNKYGIKGIPANFLIDRDFKIIATNLRGEQLEEELGKLLD